MVVELSVKDLKGNPPSPPTRVRESPRANLISWGSYSKSDVGWLSKTPETYHRLFQAVPKWSILASTEQRRSK